MTRENLKNDKPRCQRTSLVIEIQDSEIHKNNYNQIIISHQESLPGAWLAPPVPASSRLARHSWDKVHLELAGISLAQSLGVNLMPTVDDPQTELKFTNNKSFRQKRQYLRSTLLTLPNRDTYMTYVQCGFVIH